MRVTIPVWVLLAFAMWTLLTLLATVGIYRWAHILTGKVAIKEFRADQVEGRDWYRRGMRAHANCVENLPVYGAIVVVISVAGLDCGFLDVLAIILICARVLHTLVHVSLEQTNLVAGIRFTFFFAQFICMASMGGYIAINAPAA